MGAANCKEGARTLEDWQSRGGHLLPHTAVVGTGTVLGFLEVVFRGVLLCACFAVFWSACLVRMHTPDLHRNAEECACVCIRVHMCDCAGCVCQTNRDPERNGGEGTAGETVGMRW